MADLMHQYTIMQGKYSTMLRSSRQLQDQSQRDQRSILEMRQELQKQTANQERIQELEKERLVNQTRIQELEQQLQEQLAKQGETDALIEDYTETIHTLSAKHEHMAAILRQQKTTTELPVLEEQYWTAGIKQVTANRVCEIIEHLCTGPLAKLMPIDVLVQEGLQIALDKARAAMQEAEERVQDVQEHLKTIESDFVAEQIRTKLEAPLSGELKICREQLLTATRHMDIFDADNAACERRKRTIAVHQVLAFVFKYSTKLIIPTY